MSKDSWFRKFSNLFLGLLLLSLLHLSEDHLGLLGELLFFSVDLAPKLAASAHHLVEIVLSIRRHSVNEGFVVEVQCENTGLWKYSIIQKSERFPPQISPLCGENYIPFSFALLSLIMGRRKMIMNFWRWKNPKSYYFKVVWYCGDWINSISLLRKNSKNRLSIK